MKNKFTAIVSYDGTDFRGWQSQICGKSIQDTLVKKFKKSFAKNIKIIGASRTDSGVHAQGQVILVQTDLELSARKIMTTWNRSLPLSICIKKLKTVENDFHPHSKVIEKKYSYRLFKERPSIKDYRFGWLYNFIDKVDWTVFKESLTIFEGEHNFRDFYKPEEGLLKETKRTINKITIKQTALECTITFKSKGFLRYQIRRMIGAALEMSINKNLNLNDVASSLAGKKVNPKRLPSFCAAPNGLCLEKITYDN